MNTRRDWMKLSSSQQPELEFCGECFEVCEGTIEDVGIGAYEFHGQRDTDVRYGYFSVCCEGEVYKAGQLYDGPEEDDGLGDYLYEQKKDRELNEQFEKLEDDIRQAELERKGGE